MSFPHFDEEPEFYENTRPAWRDLREQYPDILSLAYWGVKRVIEKCHMGDGTFIGLAVNNRPQPKSVFKVDPADWTDNIPGTDDDRIISARSSFGWTASYLTKFAAALREFDPELASKITDVCVQNYNLRANFQKGPPGYETFRQRAGENSTVSRHDLEMLRSAMHLHRLTGEDKYRETAAKYSRSLTELLSRIFTLPPADPIRGNNTTTYLRWNSFGVAAALFEYLRYFPRDPANDEVKRVLRGYIDQCLSFASNNEFRVITSLDPDKTLAFERVGRNASICAYGYLAALGARVFNNPEYRAFAEKSAQWVLGRNPAGISMLIGKGHKFAATSSLVAAYSPGHGDGVIPSVIRGIGHGDESMPAEYPALSVAFNPGGKARSSLHEVYQVDTIMLILLCQELHKGVETAGGR